MDYFWSPVIGKGGSGGKLKANQEYGSGAWKESFRGCAKEGKFFPLRELGLEKLLWTERALSQREVSQSKGLVPGDR